MTANLLFLSLVDCILGVGESGVFKFGDFDPLERERIFVGELAGCRAVFFPDDFRGEL